MLFLEIKNQLLFDDYYHFDNERLTLTGRHSGRVLGKKTVLFKMESFGALKPYIMPKISAFMGE